MQACRLKPSLFYLLANLRRVPLKRLVHALRYQSSRLPELNLSFTQILIAFNDLHHQQLTSLREEYGEFDEDPIGHLLVDTGRMDMKQLQRLRLKAVTGSVAAQVQMPAVCDALFEELELLDKAGHQREFAFDVLLKRQMALELFKQRLIESELLSQEHVQALGLGNLSYLPRRFKPLLDVLVLLGEWPDFLQPAILVEDVRLEDEPVLQLLCRPGLVDIGVMSRLMHLFDPVSEKGINPAVLLADKRLVPRGHIVMAVQQAYSRLAQEKIRQGQPASEPARQTQIIRPCPPTQVLTQDAIQNAPEQSIPA